MDTNVIYPKAGRKNFTGLVIVDKNLQQLLWEHHVKFNEYVNLVLQEVFKARHGKKGEGLKKVFNDISSRNDGFAKLNALTDLDSKPGGSAKKETNWYGTARDLLKNKQLLFDRNKFFPDNLPTDFRQKVFEAIGQIIGSHSELVEVWLEEKRVWEENKEEWKKQHPRYFLIKPLFDEFEDNEDGTLRLSRDRWHRYYDFLAKNGEQLVKWNDKNALFKPLDQEITEKYKSEPHKLKDLLLKQNPEIKEIDSLDKKWRNGFERFKRRPSFTYPSPYKHPQYYSFKKTVTPTYRNLDLIKQSVEIQLVKNQWIEVSFRLDKRLRRNLKELNEPFLFGNEPDEGYRDKRFSFRHTYYDPNTGETFYAEPRGVKLFFERNDLKPLSKKHGKAYLYFAVELFKDTAPVSRDLRVGFKKRKAPLPNKIKILSVDMGQRDLAAITLTEIQNGKPVPIAFETTEGKKVKAWLADIRGLTMNSIGAHEKELAFGLKNMYKSNTKNGKSTRAGHITKGTKGFDRLRVHISNSKENRYKNGAHIILETAIKNKVDVIVMEWLDNYRPTLARDREHNRRRMQWDVKHIQNFLEQQINLRNMVLYKAPAYFTSKLCYRCGSFGVRCSLPKFKDWHKYYEHYYPGENLRYIREPGGYFFFCINCKKLVNADVNASFNLAKAFMGEWDGGDWEIPKFNDRKNGWQLRNQFISREEFYKKNDKELKNLKTPHAKDMEF